MGSPFLKLFGRSPFKPLQEHMTTAYECVKTLLPFFDAVLAEDWELAKTHQEKISELEHQADDMKRDLRVHLPKDFFMPVSRSNLLELVSYQDYLANQAKDIAGLVIGRQMAFPTVIHEDVKKLIELCVDTAKQAYKATRELNELLEAGFSGQEKEIIKNMLEKLHEQEHETDKITIKIFQAIHSIENELPPVDAIFLYKAIEWTSKIADCSEKVGDRLLICISR